MLFNSVQIVKLLKECGDSPNQILQTASVLEPMVEHAHFLLARKRPEAVEGTTTGETTEDSSDEEEGLNQRKGTREDLGEICWHFLIFPWFLVPNIFSALHLKRTGTRFSMHQALPSK